MQGVDEAYDAAEEAVSAVDDELEEHLKQVQEEVRSTAIVYVSLNKDSHVLEVPEVQTPLSCMLLQGAACCNPRGVAVSSTHFLSCYRTVPFCMH